MVSEAGPAVGALVLCFRTNLEESTGVLLQILQLSRTLYDMMLWS